MQEQRAVGVESKQGASSSKVRRKDGGRKREKCVADRGKKQQQQPKNDDEDDDDGSSCAKNSCSVSALISIRFCWEGGLPEGSPGVVLRVL